ncbi:hypothetical protein A2U01_0099794, partial [Trifolium medium]|nr:hypothetical protein [Trifolium medium]
KNLVLELSVAHEAPVVAHEAQLGAEKLVAAHNAPVPAPQAQIWV